MVDFHKLSAPFPPGQVSWRVGSVNGERGMALAFLDARDVMDRLDNVCGPENWHCRYSHVGAVVVCEIGIGKVGEIVWKSDGAGQSDIEPEKGALSDAFKRAAVRWGIGRYLYHLPSPWVEIEKRGKYASIAKHEYKRLEQLLADVSPKQVPQHPTPPPNEPDVEDAAARWVAQQKRLLESATEEAAIVAWSSGDTMAKALRKLKLQHPELHEGLMDSYNVALDRVRAPV